MSAKYTMYRIDVILVRFRKFVKKMFPVFLVKAVESVKRRMQGVSFEADLNEAYPWMSPNIWTSIVSFYTFIDNPVVVEFGTGASTINHLRVMLSLQSSRYIGIENDSRWFWLVVSSSLKEFHRMGVEIKVKMNYSSANVEAHQDVDVEIASRTCTMILRLRPSLEDYLVAYDQACDVVVVDGIMRKKCVRRILDTNFLRTGGLLMLMEAGRGSDEWWEGKLYGDADYTNEVNTLLSLGAVMLDGDGVDRWPSCKRKSPRPTSYFSALEACSLVRPTAID